MKGFLSRTGISFALLSTVAGTALAQSNERAFTPADWYRIARVAGPTLSPDGSLIAFTVTTVREAENKRHTEVWTQPVSGGPSKRMTSSAFESTAPRWSDDGCHKVPCKENVCGRYLLYSGGAGEGLRVVAL